MRSGHMNQRAIQPRLRREKRMTQGTRKCAYLPCPNLVTESKIFCRYCMAAVGPGERAIWRLAFPFDTPYDIAMKPDHEDQARAIERMRQGLDLVRRQESLF